MDREFHIDDSAELYAVGALDERERAEVDAHVAECPECLRRLGEAEETVLALERVNIAEPADRSVSVMPIRPRGFAAWWLAVAAAAAFILGFVVPHGTPRSGDATLAMIGSHFSHAQFTGKGPAAKVIYARDRSWYYVIVAGGGRYEVYGIGNGRDVDLGSTQPQGATSELFARVATPFGRIELRANGAAIETAAIR
ncbi:MAG TPA: zf-HC2 domain-containing protein [Candidatus Cybelea sp.]